MTLALVLNSGTWELRCAGLTLAMHSLLHSRASPGAAHRLHCPPVGLEMSTAWDRLSHIQAAGRRLKHRHRHRARQGEVTVSEPLGCQLAGTKVMLTATAGARVLPIKQGRAQICQQTAGSKRHFFLYPDAFKCL